MGVRGLTTFIAKNQENYFKKHKLRDCHVVIDAHSLCAQLYKFHAKSNDSFGGDYDKYEKCIQYFFSMLKQCNITPIIVFDGGYEKKKVRTVYLRLKSKIKVVRKANPVSLRGETVFPLFVREVLRDVVLQLGLTAVRCDFEADFEIACIARQLNCPVISYDSDFYIFDVLYIPFPTMDYHTTKDKDDTGSYYIACKIYEMDNFLKHFGGLDRSLIPLMATILGNDYIGKKSFENFYSQLKLTRKKTGERGDQQRQITAVIKWLRTETYESAIYKILGRLKKKRRCRIAKEIKKIVEGYKCTDSEILKFLNIDTKPTVAVIEPVIDINTIESDSENEENSSHSSDSESEEEAMSEGDEKMDLASVTESENGSYPEWFAIKYRKAEFPTLFMDLLFLKNCFYMPQVENTHNIYTIQISLPILQAIAKILLGKDAFFTYWARNDSGRIKKYNVEVSELDLPDLEKLNSLNIKTKKEMLMLVLGMEQDTINLVSQFPSNWQLYIYSLVYWARNAVVPEVTLCHIYSIILCMININIVDKNVGYIRLEKSFQNKYGSKVKTILDNKKKTNNQMNQTNLNLYNKIKSIVKDDCLLFVNTFVSYFTMDEKMTESSKLYCLNTVDSYAQFQSCVYFIKHINSLLGDPIENCNISSFFNGTFIYNIHSNLEIRHNVDSYIDSILNKSTTIYESIKHMMELFKSLLNVKMSDCNVRKKRKRKRKKQKTDVKEDEDFGIETRSDGSEIDENNIFSVLRLIK